jgi:hypothetical protein
MAIRFSTGLKNAVLGTSGLKGSLDAGVINIYSGAQPSSADTGASGVLLGTVTIDAGATFPADYISFDAPVDGVLAKAALENWKFNGVTNGTAGWFRYIADPASDDGSSTSTVHPRLDGSIARSGGDMNLSNTSITTGAPNTVDVFQIAIALN